MLTKDQAAVPRPEDIERVTKKSQGMDTFNNALDTRVEVIEHMGAEIYTYIDYNRNKIIARFKSDQVDDQEEKLTITFKPERLHLFDKETEESLLEYETKAQM